MPAILQEPLPPVPPVPPTPPTPPGFPDGFPGGPGGWSPEMLPPEALVMIVLMALLVSGIVLWPLMRAIGRRIERGGGHSAEVSRELDDLRARVAELEERQGGIAELEDRLDFAERLLSQQRTTVELPGRVP